MSGYQSKTAQKGFARRPDRGALVEKPKEGRQTLRRLSCYFAPERALVLLLLLVTTAGVVGSVLAPKYQADAIDRITRGQYTALSGVLLRMTVLYLLYGGSLLVQGYLTSLLSQRVVRRIRGDLFDRIATLPVGYLDRHSHGDLMSRMTNDADNISSVISDSLGALFSGLLMIIGTLGMMLWMNAALTLLSVSAIAGAVLLTALLTRVMRRFFVRRQELLGSIDATAQEMVTDFATVTAYGMQEQVISDFAGTSDRLTRTGIIAEILSSSMGPLHNMFNNISFVIVAAAGAWFALHGYISVGVISAFIVYSRQFARPVNELAQLYGQIETAVAGAERIFSVLDVEPEDESGEEVPQPLQGVITFSHVNFSYVPEKEVIHDFSLQIGSGKKIALAGATGSGKTTLINLLLRFYDIDSGQILLDGKDIRGIRRSSLRSCVGIVLQDTVLFTGTVRENLLYARPEATQEELERAAELSGCTSLIAQLPQGYDTVLTQAGASLSQGQRQLLAICRAFLSDPQILILDEATSSVDTRTEKNIQDAMVRLMAGRTSLIIAHRLSTIRDADEIIVMDHGSIAEQGSHEELLAREGQYYALYQSQFAGLQT